MNNNLNETEELKFGIKVLERDGEKVYFNLIANIIIDDVEYEILHPVDEEDYENVLIFEVDEYDYNLIQDPEEISNILTYYFDFLENEVLDNDGGVFIPAEDSFAGIFDEENYDNVYLMTPENQVITFRQTALIPFEEKMYFLGDLIYPDDYDCFIFEITEIDGEPAFLLSLDEEINDSILEVYSQLIEDME